MTVQMKKERKGGKASTDDTEGTASKTERGKIDLTSLLNKREERRKKKKAWGEKRNSRGRGRSESEREEKSRD